MNRPGDATAGDDGAPRVVRLGVSLMRRGHVGLLVGGLLAVPVFLVVILLLFLQEAGHGDEGVWELLRAAWAEFLGEPGSELMLWALAVITPLAVVLTFGQRIARIHVTSLGLRARIPRWLGLGLLGQTAGRWEVLWEAVRHVRLERPAGGLNGIKLLGWYRLVIETDMDEIRINPFSWFDGTGPDHRLRIGELFRPATVQAEQRVRDAPLIQAFEARGFQVEPAEAGWKPVGARFDLVRHRGMVGQLVVFFLAGLYALVDTYITGSYRALELLPSMPFIEAGVVAGLGAWLLGRGAPALERTVVGALTVIAVVAAVYPAILRLNAATAEPEIVAYRATAPGVFEALRAGYPAIDLTDIQADEYWAALPPGSFHEFTLMRGEAAFYQLDLLPLYARTKAFYESRSENQNGSPPGR